MDEDMIGVRVRQRRKELGLKQTDLSAVMQGRGHDRLTRQRIVDLEHGRLLVRHMEVLGFARALKCPVWWLLGMPEEEARALDIGFGER